MRETYLYPYSAEEACRRGEQSLWRASYLENIDCKDAIQKAVRQHYDGDHLDKKCLTEVIQEFGYKRTAWVLANTVQQLEWGGQYSSENKAWASQIYIPPDKSHQINSTISALWCQPAPLYWMEWWTNTARHIGRLDSLDPASVNQTPLKI